jgi:cation-transporting ATPase 13A2
MVITSKVIFLVNIFSAMVGDGANDCGALKAAHTGISLSDTESSVASPFTSRETNISCVLSVIREGRAALVTSFGIFKYMAAYSLTQFISVMLLYSIESNLTDIEFLYIDLFIISIFAFFFGKTEAYEGPLNKIPPLTSLISVTPILSLLAQILIVSVFQYASLWNLRQMDWFVPFNATGNSKDDVGCMENYTIFIVSSIQYIILAVVFSKGRPYRKAIWTNYGLLGKYIRHFLCLPLLALKYHPQSLPFFCFFFFFFFLSLISILCPIERILGLFVNWTVRTTRRVV